MSNKYYYNWQYQIPIIYVVHKVGIEKVILQTLFFIAFTILHLGKHYYTYFYKQKAEYRKTNI